jgi:uncharacterized Zn-finger protein
MNGREEETVAEEQAQPTKIAVIEVTRADLPLSCPRPADEVWNMHPRVYLPLQAGSVAVCPYCGARYRLAD